jgi:hypothetical protein
MSSVENKKNWLKQQLREESTSSATGAYNTPFAFNPDKNAKGASRNYYLDLGYKLVNQKELRKKAKGMEYKDLWKK